LGGERQTAGCSSKPKSYRCYGEIPRDSLRSVLKVQSTTYFPADP
jgi:hypothetical protein